MNTDTEQKRHAAEPTRDDLRAFAKSRRDEIQWFVRGIDAGARIARPIKVGRNAACPCGSGKKWKKRCGGVSTVQGAAPRR